MSTWVPMSRPSDYLHLKGGRRALSSIRRHALAILSTCILTSITSKCPAAFQRLPTPRVRPMRPLVHGKSHPSNRLHRHPDIVSQRPSTLTSRPYFPLRTPTTVLHWAPNDHLQRMSDIRHLCPSHIAIQQPSISASHTLYRRWLVPSSILHCVSSAALSRRFALTIPFHLSPTAHIPVRPSARLHTRLAPYYPHPRPHITIPRFLTVVQQQHCSSHTLAPPTIIATSPRPPRVVPHRLHPHRAPTNPFHVASWRLPAPLSILPAILVTTVNSRLSVLCSSSDCRHPHISYRGAYDAASH